MSVTGTFQDTDATGIPAVVSIVEATDFYPWGAKVKVLDVNVQKCGHRFERMIRVWDPDGPSPLVEIKVPVGIHFAYRIINHVTGGCPLPSVN